jgi:hypothetical protein
MEVLPSFKNRLFYNGFSTFQKPFFLLKVLQPFKNLVLYAFLHLSKALLSKGFRSFKSLLPDNGFVAFQQLLVL